MRAVGVQGKVYGLVRVSGRVLVRSTATVRVRVGTRARVWGAPARA